MLPNSKSKIHARGGCATAGIRREGGNGARNQLIRSPAIRSPAIRSPAIRSPAIRSPAIRSPATRSPAIRSRVIRNRPIRSRTIRSRTIRSLLWLWRIPRFCRRNRRNYSRMHAPKDTANNYDS